ncbi:MAG: hypothetical protein WAQ28_10885 [Bacteroidia bacterium]
MQLITFLIIGLSICIKISFEDKPYATGDGIEYSLMTEALFNHFSPNVKSSDCESFKSAFTKVNGWEQNDKASAYDATCNFIGRTNLNPLEYSNAFFVANNQEKYSVHFFFYSLLNLPVRVLCAIVPFNPLLVFYITNIILVLLCCLLLFKYSQLNTVYTAAFVLLFFYSTTFWYLCWTHPEVYTICFVTLGMWFYFQGKKYIATFLVALAALQNQPLSLLVAFLFLDVLITGGFRLKNVLKVCLCALPVFIPSLFYYVHFGETNLIKYQGALSFDYVTFTRVIGFFFDLNQGVVLAIPLLLIVYIGLLLRKFLKFRTASHKWSLVLPFVIVFMVCVAGTINNWSHGQAVVNRYVTYISAVMIVHSFFLILEIERTGVRNLALILSLLTQIVTVYYHQSMSKYDWSTNLPKPISNWVLAHFPQLYNPDPVIFIERYAPGMIENSSESPAYYAKKDGDITKFLVHKKYLDNLRRFGFSKQQIDSVAPSLNFITDWAYINVSEGFQSNLSSIELKRLDNQRKIERQILLMKKDPVWYESIKNKAKDTGITEEEALRKDAVYILGIEEEGVYRTKEQKILDQMNKIRATPDWLKLIESKAKDLGITVDSALYNDARWMVEQEMKK